VSRKANDFIKNAKIIAITFGTARVYRLVPTGQVVANCHKIPAKEFTHTLLTVDEIVSEWSKLMDDILSEFPAMQFLFTVSPIRHWKDGAIGNQLSKAILTVAVHKLISLYPNVAYYFPGYEIIWMIYAITAFTIPICFTYRSWRLTISGKSSPMS